MKIEIPNVSNLIKRKDCETKIAEIEKKVTNQNHDRYITTSEFNKLTTEDFAARLAQANFITNTDFGNTLYMSFNRKNNSNKQNILKMNLEKYKHLIQFILEPNSFRRR